MGSSKKPESTAKKAESKEEGPESTKLLEITPSGMDFSQIVKSEENGEMFEEMPPLEYIGDWFICVPIEMEE